MIESTSSWTNASGSKPKVLTANCTIADKKVGAGHVLVLGEPGVEARRDAVGLRHPADPGRLVHHPLALGDRELAEQEEAFARRGGDPVGIAAAGIRNADCVVLEVSLARLISSFLISNGLRASNLRSVRCRPWLWSS